MDNKKVLEFPDVENKLQAPSKQSVFERQKKEAEAKRLREAAETAAVYEDFVKSFDDEDVPAPGSGFGRAQSGYGAISGPPRKPFAGASIPSGPSGNRGSGAARGLYSGPGSLGPPPSSLNRKRPYEGFNQTPRRDNDKGLLAFDDFDYDSRQQAPAKAFNTSDDENDRRHGERSAEQAVAKPTLRLSSLPPGTSPAVIKSLIPANLTVDAVRIIPPSGPPTGGERKSMSAIVTLSSETAANDIDAVVNSLQNKYLGYGFYLSLHRHLSSAALSSASATESVVGASSQPFGAKQVNLEPTTTNMHAPPGHNRAFAPPTSYASSGASQPRQGPLLHVPVQAPKDIKELKLIHKTVENLLTHGPEFEALLMSRPDVQKDEKWAWLWDPRSTGGVWYRWRLWEVMTGFQTRKGQGKYLPIFEDSSAWKAPEVPLAFEYITNLNEFVSDSEYNSSDDDDSGDEATARRSHNRTGGPPDNSILNNDDGMAYLNPLEKAKLTHILARLPTSTGQLRKGDIARITAFAISHAGRGADEVVALIISNIEKPFAYLSANPDRQKSKDKSGDQSGEEGTPTEDDDEDTSSAKLIGLYLISDILSSSSTSGVRHAWRYRQLFESALRSRLVFEGLGTLEKRMNWGRLRAEKWKRGVGNVLGLWEGWCVFPQESQDHFVKVFNEPPMAKEDEKKDAGIVEKAKSKWKSVEVEPQGTLPVSTKPESVIEDDVDDVDGMPMEEDDEDVDGEPMEEDDDEGEEDGNEMAEYDGYEPPPLAPTPSGVDESVPQSTPTAKQRRPKAVDMFGESDSGED